MGGDAATQPPEPAASGWSSCIAGCAEHRKALHGALANRPLSHGADIACERLGYVSWQKDFPRSVRDRAPGLLVKMMRRKADSAGGQPLYEYNPLHHCLCRNLPVREA